MSSQNFQIQLLQIPKPTEVYLWQIAKVSTYFEDLLNNLVIKKTQFSSYADSETQPPKLH